MIKKTAIFLEGQTELILVREFLLRLFEYQHISLECFTLFTDRNFVPTEYAFPNTEATYHFQLINVGNDQSVISRMLRREQFLLNSGFDKILGLRDMYSKSYREEAKDHKINPAISQKFIDGHKKQIDRNAKRPENISFHFAIMEIEAWILGIRSLFTKIDKRLTDEFIQKKLSINLAEIDPEEVFFHPSKVLDDIFRLIESRYDKKKGDVSAIANLITKEDYESLHQRDFCNSFSTFLPPSTNKLNLPPLWQIKYTPFCLQ